VIRDGPVDAAELDELVGLLRIDHSQIVGIGLLLDSAEAVLAVDPARHYHRRVDIGLIGPYPEGSEIAFELRTLFSDQHGGIVEDPVTGSFQASAAQWMLDSGRARAPYLAAQGARLGRAGRVRIDQDDDGTVWVGGRTETLFSGDAGF
jgi:predicted PhzF superfamily epimerase YddE/YHI9